MPQFLRHCLLLLIGMASCLAFAPSPAQAQMRMCGPGETPVAMDTSNPGVHVPLCPGNGGKAAAVAESHAAFAWHVDATDIWVDGDYTGPNNAGPAKALAACARAMGEGCVGGGEWSNSYMEFYRNARGELFSAWANDKNAVKKAQADCRGDAILACERVHRLGSNTSERFPGAEVRKSYLVAAWVKGLEGYDGKLYIASGQPTYAAAAEMAIAACGKANPGRECGVQGYTGNGVMQVYLLGADHAAVVENSADRARRSAQGWCKRSKAKPCTMQAQYDARRQGLFVHEFEPAPAG